MSDLFCFRVSVEVSELCQGNGHKECHLQRPRNITVVDTAQTWASFKQLVLPEESKPAQSPLIKVVEDLEDYMKYDSTLGWFGILWEIQLFECSSGLGRVDP